MMKEAGESNTPAILLQLKLNLLALKGEER